MQEKTKVPSKSMNLIKNVGIAIGVILGTSLTNSKSGNTRSSIFIWTSLLLVYIYFGRKKRKKLGINSYSLLFGSVETSNFDKVQIIILITALFLGVFGVFGLIK